MNLTYCTALPRSPENASWYRAVDPRHLTSALSSAHTKKTITRFNPGTMVPPRQRFPTIYLAESPSVALFEIKAVLGSPYLPGMSVPHPRKAGHVMLTVQVVLRDVADLTDISSAQVPLGTSAQELTGDWFGYQWRSPMTPVAAPTGLAPTQELGLALSRAGVEGFRSISSPVPDHKTLIVFPDNLKSGSSLVVRDSSGTIVQRIP